MDRPQNCDYYNKTYIFYGTHKISQNLCWHPASWIYWTLLGLYIEHYNRRARVLHSWAHLFPYFTFYFFFAVLMNLSSSVKTNIFCVICVCPIWESAIRVNILSQLPPPAPLISALNRNVINVKNVASQDQVTSHPVTRGNSDTTNHWTQKYESTFQHQKRRTAQIVKYRWQKSPQSALKNLKNPHK